MSRIFFINFHHFTFNKINSFLLIHLFGWAQILYILVIFIAGYWSRFCSHPNTYYQFFIVLIAVEIPIPSLCSHFCVLHDVG